MFNALYVLNMDLSYMHTHTHNTSESLSQYYIYRQNEKREIILNIKNALKVSLKGVVLLPGSAVTIVGLHHGVSPGSP